MWEGDGKYCSSYLPHIWFWAVVDAITQTSSIAMALCAILLEANEEPANKAIYFHMEIRNLRAFFQNLLNPLFGQAKLR